MDTALQNFIDELRERVDMVALVQGCGVRVNTRKRGKYFYGEDHDSLMIDPVWKSYKFWNPGSSGGKKPQGDFLDFQMEFGGMEFMEALRHLGNQYNLAVPEGVKIGGNAAAMASFRARRNLLDAVVDWMQKRLEQTPAALAYAQGRGFSSWSETHEPGTIQLSRISFSGGTSQDRDDLIGELRLLGFDVHDPLAVEFVGLRGGVRQWCAEHKIEAQPNWLEKDRIWGVTEFPMLVYPHLRNGVVTYISGRQLAWDDGRLISSPDKKHKSLNLHAAFWGEKRLFYNQAWDDDAGAFFVVEGPADALTLGQWGLAAVALCGVTGGDEIRRVFERARKRNATVYEALDDDAAGANASKTVLNLAGPMARVIEWPTLREGDKDANDWLKSLVAQGVEAQEQNTLVNALIRQAPSHVERVCAEAGGKAGAEQVKARNEAAKLIAKLDPSTLAQYKRRLADLMGMGVVELNGMLRSEVERRKKAGKNGNGASEEEDAPEAVEFYLGGYLYDHLVELIYDDQKMNMLYAVRYPSGKTAVVPHLDIRGIRYSPGAPSPEVMMGGLLLPNRLGAELGELELVRMVDRFIYRYYDFGTDMFYQKLSGYYVLLSWVADAFTKGTMIPYLRAMGDYGTGKTRMAWTVGALCRRPLLVNGGSTAASIRRMIHKWSCTLVLDEADFGASDEAADISKILNGGNQVGNPIMSTMKSGDGNFAVEVLNVYGPKLIAARKDSQDKAVGSRCLTYEPVGGELRADVPIGYPPEFWTEATEIRNHLLAYRLRNWQPEKAIDYASANRALPNRLNQVTMALKTVVQDDGLHRDIDSFVEAYARQTVSERSETMTARIVEGIMRAWAWGRIEGGTVEDDERIYLKDIKDATNMIVDEMNRRMGDEWAQESDAQGQGQGQKKSSDRMTSRRVSDTMRKYLQLHTLRATSGPNEYRGTYYLAWDEKRMRALCNRWGAEWLERGSLQRPKIVRLNDETTGQRFAEERAKWKGGGNGPQPPEPPADLSWVDQPWGTK